MNKRKEIKDKAMHEMRQAQDAIMEEEEKKDDGDALRIKDVVEDLDKAAKKAVRISKAQIDEVKEMLTLIGLPFVQG